MFLADGTRSFGNLPSILLEIPRAAVSMYAVLISGPGQCREARAPHDVIRRTVLQQAVDRPDASLVG